MKLLLQCGRPSSVVVPPIPATEAKGYENGLRLSRSEQKESGVLLGMLSEV